MIYRYGNIACIVLLTLGTQNLWSSFDPVSRGIDRLNYAQRSLKKPLGEHFNLLWNYAPGTLVGLANSWLYEKENYPYKLQNVAQTTQTLYQTHGTTAHKEGYQCISPICYTTYPEAKCWIEDKELLKCDLGNPQQYGYFEPIPPIVSYEQLTQAAALSVLAASTYAIYKLYKAYGRPSAIQKRS